MRGKKGPLWARICYKRSILLQGCYKLTLRMASTCTSRTVADEPSERFSQQVTAANIVLDAGENGGGQRPGEGVSHAG